MWKKLFPLTQADILKLYQASLITLALTKARNHGSFYSWRSPSTEDKGTSQILKHLYVRNPKLQVTLLIYSFIGYLSCIYYVAEIVPTFKIQAWIWGRDQVNVN